MKLIFQFENHKHVAERFRRTHLEHRLSGDSTLVDTEVIFQDYIDRNSPGAPVYPPASVAAQAVKKWQTFNPPPEKTAWILDLDPMGSSTPDSSYGLCVIVELSRAFGLPVEGFLRHASFLSAILTLYPARLNDGDGIAKLLRPSCDLTELERLWPVVSKVQNENPSRVIPTEIARAVTIIHGGGGRVVLSNSGNDEAWLAAVVCEWLKT
jgi:hypothetical protein